MPVLKSRRFGLRFWLSLSLRTTSFGSKQSRFRSQNSSNCLRMVILSHWWFSEIQQEQKRPTLKATNLLCRQARENHCTQTKGLVFVTNFVLILIGMRGNTFHSSLLVLLGSGFVSWFKSKFSRLLWGWKLTSIGLLWHPAKLLDSYKNCF